MGIIHRNTLTRACIPFIWSVQWYANPNLFQWYLRFRPLSNQMRRLRMVFAFDHVKMGPDRRHALPNCSRNTFVPVRSMLHHRIWSERMKQEGISDLNQTPIAIAYPNQQTTKTNIAHLLIVIIQNDACLIFGTSDIFFTPWTWTSAIFMFHQQMSALNFAQLLRSVTVGRFGGRFGQFPLRFLCIHIQKVRQTCITAHENKMKKNKQFSQISLSEKKLPIGFSLEKFENDFNQLSRLNRQTKVQCHLYAMFCKIQNKQEQTSKFSTPKIGTVQKNAASSAQMPENNINFPNKMHFCSPYFPFGNYLLISCKKECNVTVPVLRDVLFSHPAGTTSSVESAIALFVSRSFDLSIISEIL